MLLEAGKALDRALSTALWRDYVHGEDRKRQWIPEEARCQLSAELGWVLMKERVSEDGLLNLKRKFKLS